MALFKELNLTNNYLFCLTFLGLAVITNLLIPVTNEVLDDLSGFIFVTSLLTGLITIILSINIFLRNRPLNKIMSIIFILVTILFEYIGIKAFMEVFSF